MPPSLQDIFTNHITCCDLIELETVGFFQKVLYCSKMSLFVWRERKCYFRRAEYPVLKQVTLKRVTLKRLISMLPIAQKLYVGA